MDSSRLIQDIQDSFLYQEIQTNICGSSLALVGNTITNCLDGDLSDSNLVVFLDKIFLQHLLNESISIADIHGKIPALCYGLLCLRSWGKIEELIRHGGGDFSVSVVLDLYRAALPIGKWDDFLLESAFTRELLTKSSYLDIVRPDTINLGFDKDTINNWIMANGFFELPMYRSSLRKKITEKNNSFRSDSANKMSYFFQEISNSTPPREDDLFFNGVEFQRWISIHHSVIIYKDEASKLVCNKRWLKDSCTIALRGFSLGVERSFLLSIAPIGKLGCFTLILSGADNGKDKIQYFENVKGILCEIFFHNWVDTLRLTIETQCNYVANLDIQ
jgi:hypothetical protein